MTPWTEACQASLSITNSRILLKLMSIESMMPSYHIILCHPLFLLPSILPSIRVFSNRSVLRIRWPKYWSFSFSIIPFNGYSGLISFRMDWLDLLAGQETIKGLFQHPSSKSSILWCSAFFIFQFLHPYMTTGKTIALTGQNFVGKVMFLLFNMLSSLGFHQNSVGKESACDAGDSGLIPGAGRSPGEGIDYPLQSSWASLVIQLVTNRLQCGRPGFSPWVGKIPWRREWLPSPIFWPGEFHRLSPWGRKESDTTE